MLKRMTALILSLALILAALPGAVADVAVSESSQLTKLQGQWKSSGFRGTLTGEVSGEGSALLGDETWKRLSDLLKSWSVSLTHTVAEVKVWAGDETIVTLLNAEGSEAARVNILSDASHIMYVQSALLGDDGQYYAFDSGFDWSSLLLNGENGWPSLLHVLMEINGATETWKEKAAPCFEQFSLALTRDLQSYVTTATEQDASGAYLTTAVYEIPVSAMMQETKALLAKFYTTPELLALLTEVLTEEEQAAYLQTDMLMPFFQMLDRVKLDGEIQVRRQYNTATGDVLFDSLTVPFPENLPLKSLTISHVPTAEDGELWECSASLDAQSLGVALNQALNVELTAQNTEEAVWTGSLLVTLPASEDPEALIREDQTLFSCSYNLNVPAPRDTNDVYANIYERRYEATLVVKPDELMKLPSFSLGGSVVMYSKRADQTSVSYLDADVTLTDLEQESAVSLKFSGRTTGRWTPTLLTDALGSAIRIDMMTAQSRLALLSQALGSFTDNLGRIMAGQ